MSPHRSVERNTLAALRGWRLLWILEWLTVA